MESLWSWFSTPPGKGEVLDPFGVFCLLVLVPGFLISAYLAGPGADRLAKDSVQLAGVKYCASIGLWAFGAGLFFFGARVMQINPLSFGEPKWLLGSVVAIILAAARCLDWWRIEYPELLSRSAATDAMYPLIDSRSRVSNTPARQPVRETTVRG